MGKSDGYWISEGSSAMSVYAEYADKTVARGPRFERLQIRTRAGLRHADRADQFAARHPRQEAPFLLFGAVIDQVMGADAVHALPKAGDAAASGFLVENRFVPKVSAGAVVVGGNVGAEQPRLAGLSPDLFSDMLLLTPLLIVRHHFGLDEARHRVAKNRQIFVHPG